MWCWRDTKGEPARVPGIDDATDLALRSDQTVWCWGASEHGQLGVAPPWVQRAPVRASEVRVPGVE